MSSLMDKSESLWLKSVQSVLLEEKGMREWKTKFQMFEDSKGLWKCGSRISKANLPYTTIHPILLPTSHPFTTLVVKWAHERVLHNGTKETLSELRTRYWIIKGRSFVRKLISKCVLCRRFEAPPYRIPPPPPLPSYRVEEQPPFSSVGVDFAGPVSIRMDKGSTENGKAWIVLYTCCVVRAVHLDVVVSLSADSFMKSFKRFTARRGLPKLLVSDNGKTFKASAKLVKSIMSHEEVKRHLQNHRIEWRFNMERAAWWGGVFERLIGSTKRCLRKMIGRATLTHEELLTAVVEIEMVLNSRPISYVSSNDTEEALTPSHLLTGHRILGLPDALCHSNTIDPDYESSQITLTKRMKCLNQSISYFWKRWRSEYLLSLRERHKFLRNTKGKPHITLGDDVVIHDESKKRGFWNLGIVKETIPGNDGLIRGAVVKIFKGGNIPKLLRRSIAHLYPLETSTESREESDHLHSPPDHSNDSGEHNSIEETNVENEEPCRPSRKAAAEARDRIIAQRMTYQQ